MALLQWRNNDLYDPWRDMQSLQNEINRLFDLERTPASTGLFDRSVSPSIDIIEDEQCLTVLCELPGMEQKDIDLTIASNVLTIKGEKKQESEEKEKKFYRKESISGSFQRTLSLPETVDGENVSAVLKDGILTIVLQKKEEAKPRQISVHVK